MKKFLWLIVFFTLILAPAEIQNAFAGGMAGSIGDTVFQDLDNDGVQDPGEPGIPGVIVTLLDSTDTPIAVTTTDANGNYLFDGINEVGTYAVLVDTATAPSGLVPGLCPTRFDVLLSLSAQSFLDADFCFIQSSNNRQPVGGEMIPIDTTALLLAGAKANALWLVPVVVAGIGIGIVIARKF